MEERSLKHQHAPTEALIAPKLFLSSEPSGWDGMVVRAYDEPAALEGWIEPIVPDTSLVMLTQGSMRIESRQALGTWHGQPLRQRDFMLRPGGSVAGELRWRSLTPTPMQTLHLDFKPDLIAHVAEDMRLSAQPTLLRRAGFQDPLIAQIGLALLDELRQPAIHETLYLQTAAHLIAVHLLSHYATASTGTQPAQPCLTQQQMQRVTEFITEHLDQRLSLDLLAAQVGFSPFHFARRFRQTTGESPHQFVIRQRIAWARHLLATTDTALTSIALTCGFANQSHLTRVFKRQLGLTPLLYRRQA